MAIWTLGAEDVQRVFREQNPWLETGVVPSSLAPPIKRPLAGALWRRLVREDLLRHQLILGPRRVGKTTVLYQTVQNLLGAGVEAPRVCWFRMDHPVLREADLGQLMRGAMARTGATPERPVYAMLDELVYARDWDLWLKTFHDERWPVRIAATSSATAALRQRRRAARGESPCRTESGQAPVRQGATREHIGPYVTEEQRCWTGCMAARMQRDFHHGLLESGIGRWTEQRLMPCLFDEFLDLVEEPELREQPDRVAPAATFAATLRNLRPGTVTPAATSSWRRVFLLTGGFPELILRHRGTAPQNERPDLGFEELLLNSQRVLRDDAVERAIYKDIPQSFGVGEPMKLERLLYTLAGQVTRLLSPTRLARNLRLAQPTLDRYLSCLERAFLVFTLPNYGGSEAKVQRRGRKLYFVDGAVRNAALQRGIAPLGDPQELGVLLENLAVSSVHALALHSGVRLHHWREGRHEVDLIFDDPRQPLAFEIGSSIGHARTGLRALIERHPHLGGHSYLVTPQASVEHADAADSGIGTLPLDMFLIAAGAQARKALLERLG